MIELVVRAFTADVALQDAWDHLAQVEHWTSWAKHIKRVSLEPPGPLTDASEGAFRLAGGARSTFRMEIYDPPKRWQWVGRFLTTKVHYDHHFEELNPTQTKLTWVVEAEGFGISVIGRLFARIYRKDLDKAIPALIDEMDRQA